MDQRELWSKILHLTNGIDVNGVPLSSGMLAKDRIVAPDKTETIKNIPLMDGAINIHSSGGCAVISVDFPASAKGSAMLAMQLAAEWLEGLDAPAEDDCILTLTITPLLLGGGLYLIYNQLVFADLYDTEKGSHLILAFDNTETFIMEDDETDFYKVVLQEEEELRRQEDEIQASIQEAEELQKKKNNPYEQYVKENITTPDLGDTGSSADNDTGDNSGRWP